LARGEWRARRARAYNEEGHRTVALSLNTPLGTGAIDDTIRTYEEIRYDKLDTRYWTLTNYT